MPLNRRLFLKYLSASSFCYSFMVEGGAVASNDMTSVKAYGARGDGEFDDSFSFIKAFTSNHSSIFIPSGIYIIAKPIELNLKKDLIIKCDDNVVIKLADNVRRTMFYLFGDNIHNFSWDGGEFDGNWAGQGEEKKNIHGRFDDASHGLVLAHWKNCSISNAYLHDFMGHHINHAGNFNFYAKNIKIKSHVSSNFPDGGARGDGITGASVNNYFKNISGFCTDDLIGLFSGIKWLPKVNDATNTIIKKIYIDNIFAESLNTHGNTYYTWHAVTIGVTTGFRIDNVTVSNVKAMCKDRGIGIITYVSNNDYNYFGTIDNLTLKNIECKVIGFNKDGFENSPIVLGEPVQNYNNNSFSKHKTIRINSVELSNINCQDSYNMKSCIAIGNITSYSLKISDILIIDLGIKKPLVSISGVTYIDKIIVGERIGGNGDSGVMTFNIQNKYSIELKRSSYIKNGKQIKLISERKSAGQLIYSNNDFFLGE